MSATLSPPSPPVALRSPLWTLAPGWGIAADLTPPEIVKARQIRVLRRWIAAGLVTLLLVCGGVYYLAREDNADAVAGLTAATDRTRQLQADARGFADVASIQGRVRQIRGEVGAVMAGDVDLVALMDQLQTTLPATMSVNQQSINISTSGVAGASGLDVSGGARIGTVSITGTGQTLDDLSDYVDRLQTIPGVVDVVPLSNAVTGEAGTSTQFSLSLGLTDALLSHRFDAGG